MVRSAVAEESILSYLQTLGKTGDFFIGLILGQPTNVKDFVIHLARTPQPSNKDVNEENKLGNVKAETKENIKNLSDVPESWVGDHARQATRMLPGGMYVIGIFVISKEDLFNNVTYSSRIKTILIQTTKHLSINKNLYGNFVQNTDKIILHFNPNTSTYSSKYFDCKGGGFKPAEFKFVPQATKWHQLDCNIQFDQNFPISENKINWSLKKNLQDILNTVEKNLDKSSITLNCEMKESDELLDSLIKKKKNGKTKLPRRDSIDMKPIQVDILIPCVHSGNGEDLTIENCSGDMQFVGQLASRVFLHQKATVNEAKCAIKEDIIRSLAARFEMHWDSIIEEEQGSPEEKHSVHEPPRRVLIPLPSSRVTLSDYLFPGEGPSEALISLEELLDLKVNEDDVIKDLEVQAVNVIVFSEPSDLHKLETPIEEEPCDNTIMLMDDHTFLIYTGFLSIIILAFSTMAWFMYK